MTDLFDKARRIFEDSLCEKTSRLGIAINDCRKRETMVVVRYGGDVAIMVFDNVTKQRKFDFIMEMTGNSQKTWSKIFQGFVGIKAQLKCEM